MPSTSSTDQRADLTSLRSKISLGQTGDALLKFVQAGVGGGGRAIRINLVGWESVIRIETPGPELLDLEALRAHLLNPEGFPDSPLRDLAVGILGFAFLEEITVTTDTHFLHLAKFEEKLRRRAQPDSAPALEIRLRRGPRSQYLSHVPTLITEHQVLLSRCAHAPVPLFLDGIRVSGTKTPFKDVHLGERHWTCARGASP